MEIEKCTSLQWQRQNFSLEGAKSKDNIKSEINLKKWKTIFGPRQHSHKLHNTHTGHTQCTPTQINKFFLMHVFTLLIIINYYTN